jgi:hypothetical protein
MRWAVVALLAARRVLQLLALCARQAPIHPGLFRALSLFPRCIAVARDRRDLFCFVFGQIPVSGILSHFLKTRLVPCLGNCVKILEISAVRAAMQLMRRRAGALLTA